MAFLKRPEVWVLLLLSLAGIGYVLWSDHAHDAGRDQTTTETTPDPDAPENSDHSDRFSLPLRWIARDDDAHLVITVRLALATTVPETLTADEDSVRLVTSGGSSVPRFFLPFDPPPQLGGEGNNIVDLRFWLPVEQLSEGLWLEWGSDRLLVKGEGIAPDWIESLAPGIEVAVEGSEWQRQS